MTEPVLKLTGLIFRGDSPNTFIGCIKEMRGVVVQGDSEDAVYRDLIEGTRHILEFKHQEALDLLRQQIAGDYAADKDIEFSLHREVVDAPVA